MTDQTGAEQQSAAGSGTGDVDVADQNRPDMTTDVQTGGATDLGPGGPDAGTDEDDAAIRGGRDAEAPRGEGDGTDQERSVTDRSGDDTRDEREDSSHTEARREDDGGQDSEEDRRATDEERQKTAEEFDREHDPEQHDVAAGEEFRQDGDWTADDAGGPQVWDNEGNLVEGSAPGQSDSGSSATESDSRATESDSAGSESSSTGSPADRSSASTDDGPRTSSLDEIRDGGYGVGSAATIDDGAVPLGHPVKAWEDTKTYVTPEQATYGEAEPHLWFADEHAAQRAGFRPVD